MEEDEALLGEPDAAEPMAPPARQPASLAAKTDGTLGNVRAYWLGCVVCMGGLLFGYDSGM